MESEAARDRMFTLGVALTAFSTIAIELMLTRIYSVTMYYHFAFMVISLALLGLAISGVATYLLPRVFKLERAGFLSGLFALLFAATIVITLWVSVKNPISLKNWAANKATLYQLYFAASVPFLCSGFALTVAISSAGDRIGRIYAFDLIGAGLGCLFVIPVLSWLGGPGAILLAAAVGAVGATLFALSSGGVALTTKRVLAGVAALTAVVLAVLAVTESGARRFAITQNPDKFLGNRKVMFEKWNAFSQITVAPAGAEDHRWIFIDADAATRMWSGKIKDAGYQAPRRIDEVRLASLVYTLRNEGPALIIGPGGGTDVISALYFKVPRVVGVEVNPIIVDDIMKGEYAEWTGDLYRDPRVKVVVDEGRSYIRRSGEKYSSIQATLVDTWAASSSGAFTLSENNLYTVEAFSEFLDHLKPGGVLAVTRWYDRGSPREFLRLLALGREALERRLPAAADLSRHFFLATEGGRGTLLLSRDPYTPEDVAKLASQIAADRVQLGSRLQVIYAPFPMPELPANLASEGRHSDAEDTFLASYLRAKDHHAFLKELPYDATPTTDDKPFFFYTMRRGEFFGLLGKLGSLERNNLGLAILLLLLAISATLTVLFVVLPLLLFRRDALTEQRGPKLRVLAYFLCLGLGFILVELGFMQQFVLFLGHPIYALACVLFTILIASGTGSALSGWGNRKWGAQGYVRRAIGVLAVLLTIYAFTLNPIFHALIGLPLTARVLIAGLLVLFPGLLMGALLPTGVRTANALGPAVVPWAWGLNGAASVVGSILAITLSMNFGFTTTLFTGITVYLIGLVALPKTG